jgi:hypothetical protein
VERALLAVLLLSSCADFKELGGGWGADLTWIPGVGQVFVCSVSGDEIELCYDGEASDLLDSLQDNGVGATKCGATQRHLGPCIYCCGDGCGRGANAFNGAWCP